MNEFLQRLKERKLVQWTVAYVAAAFALLQGIDIVAQQFGWPEGVRRGITLALVVGFFVTLVLAWYHGERGAQRVTGTELLILALLLAIGGGFLWRFASASHERIVRSDAPPAATAPSPAPAAIPKKSIAVLPFDNLSEDKGNAFFAEGVQDEILTRLAKVADLKVISRTSTQHFKSSPDDLPQIAKQLGVANILEGSVQKSNDQVRVNVQLINAATDAHLWADIYDRKLTDLFTVESDIAKAIADTLQAKLTGQEKISIAKQPTANPEAYELYVKGRFFWNKRTADDLRRSIEYFHQAIEKDPNYALAYAGLAQAWFVSSAYNVGTPNECFPQAEAAAKKALALDDNSSDAHAALGGVRQLYYFDTPGAIAEFERAIQLNPNDANAHHWLGNHPFAYSGQFDRELAEMKRAQELDPLSLVINTNLGWAYIYGGRFDEGIAQMRKTLEMDGGFYDARYTLGEALELKGSLPDAMAEYKKAIALSDDPFLWLFSVISMARAAKKMRRGRSSPDSRKRGNNITSRHTASRSSVSGWVTAMKRSIGWRKVIASAMALPSQASGWIASSIRCTAIRVLKHWPRRSCRLATSHRGDCEMNPRNFFGELKRRNVYKVAVAYGVVGWLVMQVAATIVPALHLAESLTTVVVVVTLLGFPIALVIAWAFEMTPEGMKRTEDIGPNEKLPQWSRRKFAGFVLVVALFAGGFLGFRLWRPASSTVMAMKSASSATPGPPAAAIPDKSIAVLPFENLSDEKANAYFAEGIQDEILTKLAGITDLKVISRTSTAKYQSKPEDLKTVSQQLGVAKVLEGTVQRAGDKVRINVQLIDARADSHLWAKTYDREAKDIFAVESEVSQEVADALQARLSPAEASNLGKAPTRDPEAYDLFLKGEYAEREAESTLKAEAFDHAAALYRGALERDPKFALAAARLATSRILHDWFVLKVNESVLADIKKDAEHALELAPDLPEAHLALGNFYYYGKRQYDEALTEFRRALELRPNDVQAQELIAFIYRRQGRWAWPYPKWRSAKCAIHVTPASSPMSGRPTSTCASGRMRSARESVPSPSIPTTSSG